MKSFNTSVVFSIVVALGYNSVVNAVECPTSQGDEISFVPSPVDCSKYYVCVHSEPVEMSCPEGLWFDRELNVCDFPANVDCAGTHVCANEKGICNCDGKVKYGKDDTWTEEKDVTGSIGCNNGVFGDPLFGTVKECRCTPADCKEPWVRPGSSVACYASGGDKGMKFDDAVEKCASMGGFLAEPRSDYETENVVSVLNWNASYWIGITDHGEEGHFVWSSDDTEITYSNWGKNEPNNAGGKQNCVQLWVYRDHQWDDQQCSKTSNSKRGQTTPITALCQK